MKIEIQTLNGTPVPMYQSNGAAAVDLTAVIECNQHGRKSSMIALDTGVTLKFKTGIKLNMKDRGVCAMILPRSGLGLKGINLANTTGLVDSDYQGEIVVALKNTGFSRFISHGDRIAQMIFLPVITAEFVQVDSFSTETERGESGFGSTGVS